MHDLRSAWFWAPGYGVALLLLVTPMVDTVVGLWPPDPGQVTWRFGALGLASRATMTPTLGLFLGATLAMFLGHRGVLKALSIFALVGALVLAVAAAMFMLDAADTRSQVVAEAMSSFNVASLVALAKFGASTVLWLALGIAGWKAAPRPRTREQSAAMIVAGSGR